MRLRSRRQEDWEVLTKRADRMARSKFVGAALGKLMIRGVEGEGEVGGGLRLKMVGAAVVWHPRLGPFCQLPAYSPSPPSENTSETARQCRNLSTTALLLSSPSRSPGLLSGYEGSTPTPTRGMSRQYRVRPDAAAAAAAAAGGDVAAALLFRSRGPYAGAPARCRCRVREEQLLVYGALVR